MVVVKTRLPNRTDRAASLGLNLYHVHGRWRYIKWARGACAKMGNTQKAIRGAAKTSQVLLVRAKTTRATPQAKAAHFHTYAAVSVCSNDDECGQTLTRPKTDLKLSRVKAADFLERHSLKSVAQTPQREMHSPLRRLSTLAGDAKTGALFGSGRRARHRLRRYWYEALKVDQ